MYDYLLNNWLEILGTLTGMVYLYLEYKASIWLWVTSIIMPAIYIFVYYQHGLYADFGIQIYYLLAAVYGFAVWKLGRQQQGKEMPITHVPTRRWISIAIAWLVIWAAIAAVLLTCTDSNVPYWDSFTTATSVIGLWLLARKYVEQWLVWIAVDAVCTGLYIYKGIYFTAGLYGCYTLIAVFGYRKWLYLMERNS